MDITGGGLSGALLDRRYRVGALIARGGMSTVYRGLDTRLDRPVAVKVMSPQYSSDPAFLSRFEREARLAAGLGHPGVVAVYDQGTDGEHVFLVMELVDGGTLRDLIRASAPLSVPVTVAVLEPLLAALGAAHGAGLVHRDIKPENVLISARGAVKIADFGLVRAVSSQTMATGNVILGTVAYLSPEQVATGGADARSDVYAAGIVAYEMLTGRPPYTGEHAMSVAYRHVNDDVPGIRAAFPGLPAELDQLIRGATRRDPGLRPRDASAFLAALTRLRAHLDLPRVAVPTPRRPVDRTRPPVPPARIRPAPAPGVRAAAGSTRMLPAHPDSPPPGWGSVTLTGDGPPPGGGTGGGTGRLPDEPPAGADAERRRRRRQRWILAIVITLLLGAGAAFGGWWLGGRWVSTPSPIGLTRPAAEALVRDAGLVPRVVTAHHNTVGAGQVAGVQPAPGSRQLRGSAVELVVSEGRPVVPSISPGTDPVIAAASIEAVDLRSVAAPGRSEYHETAPAGSVVRTDPAGGAELPIGAAVDLVTSKGPSPRPVPDVAGKARDDAENTLVVAGFAVGPPATRFDAAAEAGSVLGTDPAAGTSSPAGSAVSLVLAESLAVPDVRGRPLQDAEAALSAAGFVVEVGPPVFDDGVDGGSVARSVPAAGARLDPADARVSLVASTAVTVPDVSDGDIGEAGRRLEAAGLQMSVSALFGSPTADVLSQFPDAGTRVAPGAIVTVSAFP